MFCPANLQEYRIVHLLKYVNNCVEGFNWKPSRWIGCHCTIFSWKMWFIYFVYLYTVYITCFNAQHYTGWLTITPMHLLPFDLNPRKLNPIKHPIIRDEQTPWWQAGKRAHHDCKNYLAKCITITHYCYYNLSAVLLSFIHIFNYYCLFSRIKRACRHWRDMHKMFPVLVFILSCLLLSLALKMVIEFFSL